MAIDFPFDAPASGTSSFIDMLTYFNNLTDVGQGGMFFTIMLIVFGTILFLMIRAWGTEKAFATTSIIVAVLAGLFRYVGWVNDYVLTISIIVMILGIFFAFRAAERYET